MFGAAGVCRNTTREWGRATEEWVAILSLPTRTFNSLPSVPVTAELPFALEVTANVSGYFF